MQSMSGPGQTRGIVAIVVLGVVAIVVVGVMLLQQSRAGIRGTISATAPVYRPPASSSTRSPSPSVPGPTRTELTEPGSLLTSGLAATSAPLRLSVEQSVRARYDKYFGGLVTRYPGLMLIAYPGDAEIDHLLAAQTSDWTIFWAREQVSGAVLLRKEPFVAIVHPSWPADRVTMAELRALAEGRQGMYTMVSPDGGQAVRELLSMEQAVARQARAADWQAVQEYVAIHENTWALVPWDAVTFRVRVLPVEGRWPDLESLGDYPLLRSLWLVGDIPIPDGLQKDLVAALDYEPLPTVELVAVGDVMLDKAARQMIKTYGPTYPFSGEGVQPILSGADIAFGNLENPISTHGKPQPKTYTFRADPSFVDGLRYAGFDVLSLANNHIGDYGDVALTDTLEILGSANIAAVGAGRTVTEAHQVRIIESHGLKVAFLAYNQINPKSFAATATSPGTAWMEPERMATAVAAAQREADIVVVSCHWGVEYRSTSDATQQRVARVLADAGADLVLGHHPHVVEGLQYHHSTFTAYSLGNFVFYPGLTAETTETVILRCLLDISGVKAVELIPIAIKNAQPRVLSVQDGTRVVQRIRRVTGEQGGFPAGTE